MLTRESTPMVWSVDTPAMLREMVENNPTMAIFKVPVNVFQSLLAEVAERAAAIDDPDLNVLMLRLNLYDVPPADRMRRMDEQLARKEEHFEATLKRARTAEERLREMGEINRSLRVELASKPLRGRYPKKRRKD